MERDGNGDHAVLPPEDVLGDLAALLPDDVLVEVLHRVATPRSLAMSRSVCKAWRAIIDGESLLRAELRFSGLLMNIVGLRLPEFFSRPSSKGQHAVSGKLDFLPSLHDASCDYPEKG
ncbi:hypothetical protein ACQ4PT_044742 [Festuca glaucescens]